MLRLLLQSGASANIRGQTYQRTPIFMAGEAGNEEMVSLLIHYGAKLNLTDQYGMKITYVFFFMFSEISEAQGSLRLHPILSSVTLPFLSNLYILLDCNRQLG